MNANPHMCMYVCTDVHNVCIICIHACIMSVPDSGVARFVPLGRYYTHYKSIIEAYLLAIGPVA